MPSHWQRRLRLYCVLCAFQKARMLHHTAVTCSLHELESGHLKGIHHLSLVLYCPPCKGTLHLAQISRLFLVKLWAVCEESVAWKRRSGESVVIPRQKWQPHVTGSFAVLLPDVLGPVLKLALSQVRLKLMMSAQVCVWSRALPCLLPCLPAGVFNNPS